MPPRSFTIEAANKTLPLVKRVVKDIIEKYESRQHKIDEYDRAKRRENGAGSDAEEKLAEELESEVRKLAEAITNHIKELEAVGCQLKDFRTGLVDYPAEHEERPILLCWQHGENDIRFWHEVDNGFGGRQPIDLLFSNAGNDPA